MLDLLRLDDQFNNFILSCTFYRTAVVQIHVHSGTIDHSRKQAADGIPPSSSDSTEVSDSPNFIIAAVTDWTAEPTRRMVSIF